MADILFIEAFGFALFNDKVEFIGFFLPYSDKSINFARKTTGDYGYKGRSRVVSGSSGKWSDSTWTHRKNNLNNFYNK